jgi:hypothetical protein
MRFIKNIGYLTLVNDISSPYVVQYVTVIQPVLHLFRVQPPEKTLAPDYVDSHYVFDRKVVD